MISQAQVQSDAAVAAFDGLLARFSASGETVPVSFRDLIQVPNYPDRATHLFHRYPAKLLPHIPFFFLSNPRFATERARLLDPFCGSGTVLVEGALLGLEVRGADNNPLARLLARVKCTWVDPTRARALATQVVARRAQAGPPDVVNLSHWFSPRAIDELSSLRAGLQELSDGPLRDFLLVCFSATVQKVSLADPRISVPVRLSPQKYENSALANHMKRELERRRTARPKEEFRKIVEKNLWRLERLRSHRDFLVPPQIEADARDLGKHSEWVADIVITSPPYLGAQKYIRASSLCLGWLGLTPGGSLTDLKASSIGREQFRKVDYEDLTLTGVEDVDLILDEVYQRNPLRAEVASRYVVEMRDAWAAVSTVIRPGGTMILVTGNNVLSGIPFPTAQMLEKLLVAQGFTVKLRLSDHIHSRGLLTKRHRSASIIRSETVCVLERSSHE